MCENLRKIAVCALISQKWRLNSKCILFWEVMFLLYRFRASWGNLSKFGGNLGKNGAWNALIWKNAPILWSFVHASSRIFGQKSFAPPKICLLLHRRLTTNNRSEISLDADFGSFRIVIRSPCARTSRSRVVVKRRRTARLDWRKEAFAAVQIKNYFWRWCFRSGNSDLWEHFVSASNNRPKQPVLARIEPKVTFQLLRLAKEKRLW